MKPQVFLSADEERELGRDIARATKRPGITGLRVSAAGEADRPATI